MKQIKAVWIGVVFGGLTLAAVRSSNTGDFSLQGESSGDSFGCKLAPAGDVNGDGREDCLVSAPNAILGGGLKGKVYIFDLRSRQVLHQWSSTTGRRDLGALIAGLGDIDADGYDDVVLGSEGKAECFSGRDGHLLWATNIFGSVYSESFDLNFINAGDLDGDGTADLLYGRGAADLVQAHSGRTGQLLWERGDGSAWSTGFGTGLSAFRDFNGDGRDDVLIGAPYDFDLLGADVYICSGLDGSTLHSWTLAGPSLFGWSVCGVNDLTGDGLSDVVVGAPRSPAHAPRAGAAYAYDGQGLQAIWQRNGAITEDHYGYSVAGMRDVDGDGIRDIAVSAPGVDVRRGGTTYSNVGKIYLVSGGTGATVATKTGAQSGAHWGENLINAGDIYGNGQEWIATGAPYFDGAAGVNCGAAHFFRN